jgi:hypothetical protein
VLKYGFLLLFFFLMKEEGEDEGAQNGLHHNFLRKNFSPAAARLEYPLSFPPSS